MLEALLNEQRQKLQSRRDADSFADAETIARDFLRPIVEEHGWNVRLGEVQYSLSIHGEKVDIALMGQDGVPRVLIFAAHQGYCEHDDQHADTGTSASVITQLIYPENLLVMADGESWDFFLPMKNRTLAECRFAHFDMLSGDIGDLAKGIGRFLRRDAVLLGDALDDAEARIRRVDDRDKVIELLRSVWHQLLSGPDSSLLVLLVTIAKQRSELQNLDASLVDQYAKELLLRESRALEQRNVAATWDQHSVGSDPVQVLPAGQEEARAPNPYRLGPDQLQTDDDRLRRPTSDDAKSTSSYAESPISVRLMGKEFPVSSSA
ncbi:hypothetical protein [Candidatus Poriferisodalis sp.]|uniref:hypothetical protein n=1 Tax=Candidatus Poriferisodalis sp. TaxID=3101277 RepID=UPI003B01CCD8